VAPLEFEGLGSVSKCLRCTYSSNMLVFSQNANHIITSESKAFHMVPSAIAFTNIFSNLPFRN
jgi:hypothetical protein